MSEGCARSHPHEEMDCCCKHKTEIARANHRISVLEGKRWHYPAHNLDLPNMPEPDQIVVVYYFHDDGSERGPVIMTPITSSGAHAAWGNSIFQPITRWCEIPQE